MKAGAAEVRLELPVGIPLMGYGARQGVAQAVHDPLHTRALYLESGGRALLVQLEVCLLAVSQARALRERIARRTGLAPQEVWIAATHTHSGPETGIGAVLAGEAPPAWVEPILDAAVEAAGWAVRRAARARIGLGSARAAIGRNRREPGGTVDPEVVVLRVDGAGGTPRAIAFVHGTHPTVLGHENLEYSADWPAAAAATVRAAFPSALPIFLLGAHADVDPRTRGLQDLAQTGQSLGAGFEACAALGRELGLAVAESAARIETRDDLEVRALGRSVALPVHGAGDGEDARRERLARRAAEAARALGLDPAEPVRVARLLALERERTEGLPAEERRERISRVRLFVRDRTAERVAGGLRPDVLVQLLRIGSAAWLGLPAEATAEVGLAWKAGRAPGSALLSNVGGWLRYLPHPDRFRAPAGEQHYEVLMSTFEPGAALALLAAGEALALA